MKRYRAAPIGVDYAGTAGSDERSFRVRTLRGVIARSNRDLYVIRDDEKIQFGIDGSSYPIKVTREEYESLGCPECGVVLPSRFIREKLGL